jgi:hypothetical protein
MSSATVLALLLGLPADAQPMPAVALEVPPPQTSWTEHWTVSISTGRSFYDSQPNDPNSSGIWQPSHRQSEIRVTHQGTPLVIGAAIHRIAYPAGPDISAVGAGLVFGARHPILSWLYVELDATLGLQRPSHIVGLPMPMPDSSGGGGGTYSSGPTESGALELYARLSAGFALRVASWLEMPVGLNLQMHPIGENHSLGAASVGLRCLLP